MNMEDRFWPKVLIGDTCWPWTGSKLPTGYGTFGVKRKPIGAHRVSWMLSHGDASLPSLSVLHKCDNPSCVRPSHLFLGTHQDNMNDMKRKGRSSAGKPRPHAKVRRGDDSPFAKLTWAKVTSMRAEYVLGATQVSLASKYGISFQHASEILRGKRWAMPT